MTNEKAITLVNDAFGGYYSEWAGTFTEAEKDELVEANRMAISALEGKDTNVPSKWIPVSERMPDNTDTVLIVHKGGVSTGWYNGRYWERGASSNHRMLKTVTHWMPFPKAPKGE